MTERRIGPFILGTQLGAGGMGIVYRATYTENGREVALKVLPPGLVGDDKVRARFEREIGILKKLAHPNIVRYYGGGTHDGQRWYAMELVDGGSLSQILKRRGRLNPEQAIQAGRQICAALEHAHNAGIIHRDLKPGNIFISSKGKLKLGDFGIARDTEASPLTAAGKTVGTYGYMAPEQIRGSAIISRKTDLYALGCLLYEILTGQTPFLADNPAEMLLAHLGHEPFPVISKCPECPPALDALILRLLEKDPEDRPFDALAVHTELTEILQHAGPEQANASTASATSSTGGKTQSATPADGKSERKKKKRRLSRFYERTPFLVACLVLLIAGTAWLLRGPSEQMLHGLGRSAVLSVLRNPSRDDALSILDDARRLYLEPALERFPNGQFAAENAALLADARSLTLELQAEVRLRTRRDGRNPFENMAIAAFKAQKDPQANPLLALELLQELIELTEIPPTGPAADVTADYNQPGLWKQAAERRLDAARNQFLKLPNHTQLIARYLQTADSALSDSDLDKNRVSLQRFQRIFRNQTSLQPWLEYVDKRIQGEPAEPPAVNSPDPSEVPRP
jgi:serine/threonine-protein kinase